MVKLQSILCPTDFSEFSDHAIGYACELAEKFQAELHLLNVLQDYDTIAPGTGETFTGSQRGWQTVFHAQRSQKRAAGDVRLRIPKPSTER